MPDQFDGHDFEEEPYEGDTLSLTEADQLRNALAAFEPKPGVDLAHQTGDEPR